MSGLGQSIAEKAVLQTLFELVKDGILKLSDAAARVNMSPEEFSSLMNEQKD